MKKTDYNYRIEYFKKCVHKYIDFFDLNSWEVYFQEQEKSGVRATCCYDDLKNSKGNGSMIVNILWTKSWLNRKNVNDKEINKVAFHEAMEILLAELRSFAINKYYNISEREVDKENHRIIRTFENKVLPLIKDN